MENAASKQESFSHPALDVLRQFFTEMNRWEERMIRGIREDDERALDDRTEAEVERHLTNQKNELRAALAKIFERFCESGLNAKRVSDVLHCGGGEPDYNPDTERILSIIPKKDRVVVETQMAHNYRFKFRYELLNKDGTWRIRDNRKGLGPYDKAWHAVDL